MRGDEQRRQQAAYKRGLLRAGSVGGLILAVIGWLAITAFQERQSAKVEAENSRRSSYYAQIRVAQQELENANITRVEEILNNVRPRASEKDLRSFEWYNLWQLSHQQSQTLRLEHQVVALQFAPDGKQIAIGEDRRDSGDERAKYRFEIYDWAERKKLKSFDADSRGPFNRVVFTPDMQKVLIDSSDNTARLLEVGSGDTLRVFRAHNQFISASAISKDGANVATADILGALQLGKSAKNSNDRRLERQQGQITCVDFSPDG